MYLPYIFPSSDKIIFRLPHGGYMAKASWKLCSISGLHTPSASADDKSFSSSLISPTSKCLLSAPVPFVSADPNWPAGPALTGVHGDVMVLAPTTLSIKKEDEKRMLELNIFFGSTIYLSQFLKGLMSLSERYNLAFF